MLSGTVSDMPRPDLLPVADRLLGGRLAEFLEHYRQAGVSWNAIATLLEGHTGLRLSAETLRRWGQRLGIKEKVAA